MQTCHKQVGNDFWQNDIYIGSEPAITSYSRNSSRVIRKIYKKEAEERTPRAEDWKRKEHSKASEIPAGIGIVQVSIKVGKRDQQWEFHIGAVVVRILSNICWLHDNRLTGECTWSSRRYRRYSVQGQRPHSPFQPIPAQHTQESNKECHWRCHFQVPSKQR